MTRSPESAPSRRLALACVASLLLSTLIGSRAVDAAATIEHWTTGEGLSVHYVHSSSVPLLDLILDFDAGSARDGDQPGLARMVAGLIGEGAGDLDADAISRRFDDAAARFQANSGRDQAGVRLRTLVEPEAMATAIDTLRLTVSAPSVPEDALERIRSSALTSLQRAARDPAAVARDRLWQALYPEHPYGQPPGGTEASLAAIDRKAILDFHRSYYTAANATLTLVGAIDRAQAEAIARELAASLPQGPAPEPIPAVPTTVAEQTIRVQMPGSQTVILRGALGYARGDARHEALTVINQILGGGGLGSRLLQALREDRGLSYGAGSGFLPMRQPGPFSIQTQVRNDRAEEALAVMDEEMARLLDPDPDRDGFGDAVRHLSGSFPLALDSNAGLAGLVSRIAFYDLPLDTLDTAVARIEAVEADAAFAHWREWAEQAAMVTVLVGPEVGGTTDSGVGP